MARFQRGPRAISAPIEIHDLRTLTRADLAVLAQPRPANSIQNLRDSHHAVARAVAAGMSDAEVAQATGYSIGRVNMLRRDPAFQDLIAHKRAMIDAEFASAGDAVIDYLKGNALKAAKMLSDKLDHADEQGEFLPTRDLLGIAELGFDRVGYGKQTKNLNVNVDFAANLERARRRTTEARTARVIEAIPHEPQSAPAASPPSLGSARRPVPVPRRF